MPAWRVLHDRSNLGWGHVNAAKPMSLLRRLRVDTRLLVGIALVVVSVIGGIKLAAAADHTVGVVASARQLPANHRLAEGDLRIARVNASNDVLDVLVSEDDLASLAGQVLLFPLEGDALLHRAALADSPTRGREITVPVTPEHALGGRIQLGDRIDVLGSFDDPAAGARTLTVATDAVVVELVRAEGLFGQREGALSALTLSVAPDDTLPLAFAIRNANLDVIRTTGSDGSGRASFDGTELG